MNLITHHKCQFKVLYQPLVCLATGQISGFEALLRWQHPTKGCIFPVDFIPIAEDTGLIVPLGAWVLRSATRHMYEWQQIFDTQLSKAKISVNISSKQLLHSNLVQQVEQILRETGLNPSHLKLEITESLLMENFDRSISILEQLNQLGIELSIDDFGTGYSLLGRLQILPIDTLKIDRCFVTQMDRSTEKLEIVKAIATMAHTLKINIVVEGIETPRQLAMIKDLKCHQGQGYYFAKPLDVKSVITLLSNQFHWTHHFTNFEIPNRNNSTKGKQ